MENYAFIYCHRYNPCHISSSNTATPVVALILARGGSKGIPLKNLALLDGKSLLGRTLETAIKSSVFSEIWVSTDHPVIAQEAINYNVSVFSRSEEYARDSTASIASVQEFIRHHPVEKIVLIQCTSPFIRPEYLQEAHQKSSHECVFSVRRSHEFRWNRDEDSGPVVPLNLNPFQRPRRQDWSGEFVENGMFYMADSRLIAEGTFQSNKWVV